MIITVYAFHSTFKDFAMRYWRDKGTPVEKLNMGFATYGRTFQLSTHSDKQGAPISGPAAAGIFTREAGVLSYYEVMTYIIMEPLHGAIFFALVLN